MNDRDRERLEGLARKVLELKGQLVDMEREKYREVIRMAHQRNRALGVVLGLDEERYVDLCIELDLPKMVTPYARRRLAAHEVRV